LLPDLRRYVFVVIENDREVRWNHRDHCGDLRFRVWDWFIEVNGNSLFLIEVARVDCRRHDIFVIRVHITDVIEIREVINTFIVIIFINVEEVIFV